MTHDELVEAVVNLQTKYVQLEKAVVKLGNKTGLEYEEMFDVQIAQRGYQEEPGG